MLRATRHTIIRSIAACVLAGCASYKHPVVPLDAEARTSIDELSLETVTSDAAAPSAPSTPGKGVAALTGFGGSILYGAAAGAKGGNFFTVLLGAGLGIAAAPFVALGAAIVTPTEEEVQTAGAAIGGAIIQTRWDTALEEQVKKRRSIAEAPPADASRLKLSIEGPWLVAESLTAIPALTVHGELLADDTCLIDRRWRWNGARDEFVDLGEDQASKYRVQMEKGLAALADAVVTDLFVSNQPRLTEYSDEAHANAVDLPLLVTQPLRFQGQVGSWDVATDQRCRGLLAPEPSAPPATLDPPPEHCRGRACRGV